MKEAANYGGLGFVFRRFTHLMSLHRVHLNMVVPLRLRPIGSKPVTSRIGAEHLTQAGGRRGRMSDSRRTPDIFPIMERPSRESSTGH